MCFGDGGCYFLARGGIPGHVPGHALLFSGSLINSVQAMLSSFLAFAEFGTGEGLLRYGICVPCSKRLPPVRDAFSEDIRCKKQAFPVQDGYSVPETPFTGTGQAWCPENSLVMHGAQFIKRRSVQGRASFFTE